MIYNSSITNKQEECLQAIIEFKKERGYAPTIRELGAILNNSSSATVHRKVKALKDKGYITYELSKSRSINVRRKYETNRRVQGNKNK